MTCILFTACNNKNSLVGFPSSHINTYEVTIPDSCFEIAYSWGDSIKPYSSNTKLLLGNYDNIEARPMIKFGSIPGSITVTGTPKLYLKVNNKENCSAITFSIFKISKDWDQNLATWLSNDTDETWNSNGGDYNPQFVLNNVLVDANTDTLEIDLPVSLIQSWSDADSSNYGIMLIQNINSNNQYVEFYSANSSSLGPRLKFEYTSGTNTETKTYNKYAASDCFIHSKTDRITQIDTNNLSIWNIPAKALAFKVNLPWQLFNQAGAANIQSENDLKLVTINRANLVLTSKNDNIPNTIKRFSLYTYFSNSAILNNPNYFESTGLTYAQSTIDSLSSNQLSINVTPLMQGYVSKKKVNNGFVVKSAYANMDFSRENFYGLLADATKRPKVVIKFSTFR